MHRLPRGPCYASAGLETAREGVEEFVEYESPSDDVFQSLYDLFLTLMPSILYDWGWERRVQEEGVADICLA